MNHLSTQRSGRAVSFTQVINTVAVLHRRKQVILGLIAALMTLVAPASTVQAYEQSRNTYTTTGLDGYTTSNRMFTIAVDGPSTVCEMTFRGQVRTTIPWDFIYDPTVPARYMNGSDQVLVTQCDGTKNDAYVHADIPFEFGSRVVSTGGATVSNRTPEQAFITVTGPDGAVITSGTAGSQSSFAFTLPKTKRGTTTYTATAVTDSGVSMSRGFTRAVGWGLLLNDVTVTPCSTVTWAYDSSRQPGTAKKFKADIVSSLNVLAQQTGLTFVETQDFANAQLRYLWGNTLGAAGTGSTDGTLTFNATSFWVKDTYAGFAPFTPYTQGNTRYTSGPAGRGWLIVHETMHSLGFDHVDNQKSIMAPINRGQGAFTKGDLEGLRTMYLSRCPA